MAASRDGTSDAISFLEAGVPVEPCEWPFAEWHGPIEIWAAPDGMTCVKTAVYAVKKPEKKE